MADNITIQSTTLASPPAGTVVATDEITWGAVLAQAQVVKLVASADGSAQPLSKAEDAAHASGDHGILALAVRSDTAAALAGTDGDYIPLITDASGRLHTNVGNTVTVQDGGGSITIDGAVSVSGTVTVDSELTTADLDTGAGTDTKAVVGLAYAASGGGVVVSATNPLPVVQGHLTGALDDVTYRASRTDRSLSTVTTSSTQLMASNANRRKVVIQNISDVVMWINFGGTAAASTAGSYRLEANGGSYTADGGGIETDAINIIAASGTNKVVSAFEL